MIGRHFWFDLLFAPPPTKSYNAAKKLDERKRFSFKRLNVQSYSIINTSPGRAFGAHWLLLLLLYDQQQQSNSQKEGTFFFCVWDPLGQPVERYQLFSDQLLKVSEKKPKLKYFKTSDSPSSLHIQTLVVFIASTLRNIRFKKLNNNQSAFAILIPLFFLYSSH